MRVSTAISWVIATRFTENRSSRKWIWNQVLIKQTNNNFKQDNKDFEWLRLLHPANEAGIQSKDSSID